jgi:hypothetical protein
MENSSQTDRMRRLSSQKINFYAAFGTSIIFSVVVVGLILMAAFSSSAASSTGYNLEASTIMGVMIFALCALILTLFICLPVLIAGRYGLRTVLMTIILEGATLFAMLFLLALFFNGGSTSQYNDGEYYGSGIRSGPSIAN